MVYKLVIGSNTVEVNEPVADKDKWVTQLDLKYRPDKDGFILNKWGKDYPNIKIEKAEQIYKLASRSSSVNKWLASSNVDYAKMATEPSYLQGSVSAKDYADASENIRKINDNEANRAAEIKRAAEKFDAEVKLINKKYDDEATVIKGDQVLVKILTIPSNKLPVSIALAIENHTIKSKLSSQDSRAYAREMLVQYKLALIKFYKNNPTCDIDAIIEEFSTKL